MRSAFDKIMWEWQVTDTSAPIITYGDFSQYLKIAQRLSEASDQLVIWTLPGSPLDVNTSDPDRLSTADRFFSNHDCKCKIRIVVFSTWREVTRYRRALSSTKRTSEGRRISLASRYWYGISGDTLDRILAFENSCRTNNCNLYYTATYVLRKHVERDCLDVGFVTIGSYTYCFISPFAARSQSTHIPHQKEKITFYRLNGMNYPGAEDRDQIDALYRGIVDRHGLEHWYFADIEKLRSQISWTWGILRLWWRVVRPVKWLWRSAVRLWVMFKLYHVFS